METKTSVRTVTPEMAQKWLIENRYEHQRSLRMHHVKFLAEEIEMGTFKQDTPIEFTHVNGQFWITDGQHRLSAVTMANVAQRFVIIDRYLNSEIEVAHDYTRTDRNIIRTAADEYRVLLLESELGFTSTQINHLGRAVSIIDRGFMQSRMSGRMHSNIRLGLMREYSEAYGDYIESIAGVRKDFRFRMERATTIAIAVITFRFSADVYGKDKVDSFWNGIAMDDGLRRRDPRKTALLHLMDTSMSGGAAGGKGKIVTVFYTARYLAACFNAYVTDQDLLYARPDMSKPVIILGSPFNGK